MENVLIPHTKSLSNLVKAKDYKYFDNLGNEFIDLESGIWCASLGHSHPKIVETIQRQTEKIIHAGTKLKPDFINEVAIKILNKAGIKGKVFFMNTGSEAIDFAISLAKLRNEKSEITGFKDNYLGAYGQVNKIKSKIDIKECLKCKLNKCKNDCPTVNNKIKRDGIFIFDPFCFARQVLEIPAKLIDYLKAELKKKKNLLILDEITSGLGRTGKWFGFQHYYLKPDLIVLGKTLGNGYPVSAVIIDQKVVKLAEKKKFTYAQSHQNDPLGCQIANTVMETLSEEKLIIASEQKGEKLKEILTKELYEHEYISEIRGKGLMLAIVVKNNIAVENIYHRLIKKGIIIGLSAPYNILNLLPPFTIPETSFNFIAGKIKEAIIEEGEYSKEISGLKQKFLSYKY